jgi:hypothetical protein
MRARFRVPETRRDKYIPLLQKLMTKTWISYATLESIVGKLASLECAVAPGMWYTQE